MAPLSAAGSRTLQVAPQRQLRTASGSKSCSRRVAVRTVAAASNRRDREPLPGFHPSIRQPVSPGPQESTLKPVPKAIILERSVGFEDPDETVVVPDEVEEVKEVKPAAKAVVAEKKAVVEHLEEEVKPVVKAVVAKKKAVVEHLEEVKPVVKAVVTEKKAVVEHLEEVKPVVHEEVKPVVKAVVIEKEAAVETPEEPVVHAEPALGVASCILDQDMGRSPVAEVVKQWEESLMTSTMDIVFCASECAPWSKTGGLGDVMGSVPKALAERGHNVMVVVPRYQEYEGLTDTGIRKKLWCFGQENEITYYHKEENGVNYVFVGHGCYQRPGIYADANGAYTDNQMRFTLLSLACCEAPLVVPLPSMGGEPMGQDVMFVANDWHTAMVPVYLAGKFRPHGVFKNARSCLAIHNLSHQGVDQGKVFNDLGLPHEWYGAVEWSFPEWSDQYEEESNGAAVNFLKGGLVTADRLLTVSEGYAWEITTPEGGWGLDEIIKSREFVLDGIVNGIDYDIWNPEVDTDIAQQYDENSFVEGKAACKAALQQELGLPVRPEVPLIGFIGRLDYQKGPDLIKDAIDQICGQDVQMVMLGSGDQEMEQWMREAEGMHQNFRGWVGFSVPVSHRITAGADILLMPSRFEPCGLNQLYAMKYGTVPVVHAAGGLRDTVKHHEDGVDDSTGFVFTTYGGANVEGMMWALNLALRSYWDDRKTFLQIAKRGMEADFTWDTSAARYMQVFEWAMGDPPHCG